MTTGAKVLAWLAAGVITCAFEYAIWDQLRPFERALTIYLGVPVFLGALVMILFARRLS